MEDTMPDTGPMESQGQALVAQARATKISTPDEYQAAGERLLLVKALVREIQQAFALPKKKAHETHKSITSLESKLLADPQQAEAILKRALGDWQQKETRRIQEEERRLAEEARKREEERRLVEAVQLEELGQPELAAAVIEEPVYAPVVSIPKPKIAGISTQKKRSFRIVDPLKIRPEFLLPNETAIRRVVEAMGKDAESVVGGIEFYEETITRVGSR